MFSFLTLVDILGDSTVTQGAAEKMAGSDIYIVLIVTLIVWGGIFFYLMYLDNKLKSIKKKVDTFRRK
jgi:CcmD family protein